MTRDSFRTTALIRMAIAITALTLAGHTFLGFEQSWAQVGAALGVAYTADLLLEAIDARVKDRRPRFAGGIRPLATYLLSPHITALSVSLLLYANENVLPIMMATAAAIGSKWIFRAPVGDSSRHFFNPSNFGIAFTLLALPWVGVAMPYQFTENVTGIWNWVVPGVVTLVGTYLNARFTRKLPLIGAWVGGFALQAVIRSLLFGTPVAAALAPMTGMAFLLYSLYMITDPATSPSGAAGQVVFGVSIAAAYAVLQVVHVVFGLFFALSFVCLCRGLLLYAAAWARRSTRAAEPKAVAVGGTSHD
jgi:enediyne biosynthesis protein E5